MQTHHVELGLRVVLDPTKQENRNFGFVPYLRRVLTIVDIPLSEETPTIIAALDDIIPEIKVTIDRLMAAVGAESVTGNLRGKEALILTNEGAHHLYDLGKKYSIDADTSIGFNSSCNRTRQVSVDGGNSWLPARNLVVVEPLKTLSI